MKVLIFSFLFFCSALVHANTNEQYYIELTNPKVVGNELAFEVRMFPKQENVVVIAGNIRYNFDKNVLSATDLPRFEILNKKFELDAVGFVGRLYDSYVNLAFSSPDLKGEILSKEGVFLGKVFHKMEQKSSKDEKKLLLPRVFNVQGYKNPEPVTNRNNCTKIFTTTSPYEPVQEGLPVNKVHFYTEQVLGTADLSIYPNPSTGALKYNWQGVDYTKEITLKMFDQTGRLIMDRSLQYESFGSLDISALTPGIYFVQFENGDRTERHKLIKVD